MEIDLVSMPSRLFKPADGYEVADASATLVLRNLGEGVTLLSPHRLATMGREDVERMISSYANQLELCITRTAEAYPDNLIKLQKRIIVSIRPCLNSPQTSLLPGGHILHAFFAVVHEMAPIYEVSPSPRPHNWTLLVPELALPDPHSVSFRIELSKAYMATFAVQFASTLRGWGGSEPGGWSACEGMFARAVGWGPCSREMIEGGI